MPHEIASLTICLIPSFSASLPSEKEDHTCLESLKFDRHETSVLWEDAKGTHRVISRKVHKSSAKILLRFIWFFIAYREQKPEYRCEIPQKLASSMIENLRVLSLPNRGSAAVRQLFGPSVRFSKEVNGDIDCCRIIHLFNEVTSSDDSKPTLHTALIPRSSIHVRIRPDDSPVSREAKPHEVRAILKGFDPVTGKTFAELSRLENRVTLPSEETEAVDDPASVSEGSRLSPLRDEPAPPKDESTGPGDSRVTAEFDAATLEETYLRTAEEIETLLASSLSLREFLLSASQQAFKRTTAGVILSEDVRNGRIDMCAVLKSIKVKLSALSNSADQKGLLKVVGGLFVFAVNPRWVLKQRASMRSDDVVFTGKRETVPFKQSQSAELLPLLIAALADGFAHLEEIFGKPSARHLKIGPPTVGRGVLRQDKLLGMQLHFIDYLLKPSDEVDREDPEDIADVFGRVCTMLRYAREEERLPYYTSNRNYAALSSIIRKDFNMHLLLIYPSGEGVVDTLITDPVFLFSHASEIFQTITDSLNAT